MKQGYQKIQIAIQKRALHFGNTQKDTSFEIRERGWYFDFYPILSDIETLDVIAELFWEKFAIHYPFQIAGVESAAFPLLTAIALKGKQRGHEPNTFFIRKSRKKTNATKIIEGIITSDPIIIVDDFIDSGKTCIRALEVLSSFEKKVLCIFCILQIRDLTSYTLIETGQVHIEPLFTSADFGLPIPAQKNNNTSAFIYDIVWTFKSLDPNYFYVIPKSAPVIDNERVYFGSDNGNFWALNQNDGSVAWKFKVGLPIFGKSIFSSPALYKNRVFFGSYDGNVYALNTKNGGRLWIFREADWVGSSPALAPSINLLFIGLEFGLFKKKGGIAALNMETGEKVWEQYMPEYTHSSPAYFHPQRVVVVGCNDGVVRAYRAKTGTLLWSFETRGPVRENFAFDEKKNRVLFGSHDGYLYALDIRTGKKVALFNTGEAIYSAPRIHNNIVCIASLNKRIYGLDRMTLEKRWEFETAGRIFASPHIINENIYIGSNDGRMYEIESATGKQVSFFQTAERIVNKIAYNEHSKCIFLPTFANEIFCLRKKKMQ